jgi:hypothetical protein
MQASQCLRLLTLQLLHLLELGQLQLGVLVLLLLMMLLLLLSEQRSYHNCSQTGTSPKRCTQRFETIT